MTGAMQIESCRKRLEEFEQTLNRELYRYFSGLKQKLEIVSLYSDYSDIFSRESIRETEAELEKTGEWFGGRRKSLSKILQFLTDQNLEMQSPEGLPEAYIAIMRAATGLRHIPEAWLYDTSDGFEIRRLLEGMDIGSHAAGLPEKQIWQIVEYKPAGCRILERDMGNGTLYTADELAREIGLGDLNPQLLADELSEGLKS